MGSVTDNWYLSGTLHIESESSDRPDKDAWQEHFGHANIWGKFTKIATSRMWGLQNSYGILQNWESDSLFIGLKDEGFNRKDAVIAFGDDQDDSLRFLFAGVGAPLPAPKELLRITADGSVGIGATVPSAKLEVNLFNDKGWGGNLKGLRLLSPDNGYFLDINTYIVTGGNVGYQFSPNGNTGLVITTPGNVGIGTTDVKRTLQVEGQEIHSGGPAGGFSFSNRGTPFVEVPSQGERWVWYSHENKARLWSGNDKFSISKEGKLEINGELTTTGNVIIGSGGYASLKIRYIDGKHNQNDQPDGLHLNRSNGQPVHVGGAAGGDGKASSLHVHGDIISESISYAGQLNKLDVAEGDYARIRATDLLFGHSNRRGDVGRALVDEPRDLVVDVFGKKQHFNTLVINYGRDWGAVVIEGLVQTPSSRQLKENICMLSSQVAKNIISTLEPVSFTYKQDTLKLECLGFIAEDAPPEVTLPTKDTITFNHIVAALTRVVKDQEQSITELNLQIKMLKNSIFNTN
jgi:hypothetical protein